MTAVRIMSYISSYSVHILRNILLKEELARKLQHFIIKCISSIAVTAVANRPAVIVFKIL